MDSRIISGLIGSVLGAFVLYWFFWPEFTENTEVVEIQTVDTTYAHYKEKYRIDSLKWTSLNDSIDFYKSKYQQRLKDKNIVIVAESEFIDKPILAPIRRFTGQRSFLYGNVYFTSVVAGELIEIDITTDFKIPTINNRISRIESTINTEKPRGLYVGASITSELIPAAQLLYLDKQYIFSGSYSMDKTFSIGISKKLF